MNLQNIVVRVTEMAIGTAYNFETHADDESAKVVLSLEKGQGIASLNLYVNMAPGAPNPFTLGQRLAITIDAVPALHEPPPATPPRDEAVGLGEQFDRDVIPPPAPVPEEVTF